MPEINVTAKTLRDMAQKKMEAIQVRMDELHGELSGLMEEHAVLYSMVLAYEGPKPGEVIEMDGPPNKVIGSSNIKLGKEF